MQNRPNAFTQRGGDTILMERLAEGLRALGIQVEIDVSAQANLASVDLVHLFNFALPELTEFLAQHCVQQGKPYVVTTLYEDWPKFFNQMHIHAQALGAYRDAGQPREKWPELAAAAERVEPRAHLENTFAARHAAGLLATGLEEVRVLKRDYGGQLPIFINHVGCDISEFQDDGSYFRSRYGISDFILCVGRIETRKNQLMLLKALEDSELPLVFAAGGFTYQPEYSEHCRKFKRKGETLFLERLTPEELTSAFSACKVHALPSWYELPGIVSLEAARLGANVIVSDNGTSRDYFGPLAFYPRPESPEDIHNAVLAAYYQPKRSQLAERAAQFTWENSAKEVLEVYRRLLPGAAS